MFEVFTLAAPVWQWVVAVVVVFWLWESVVEHWFYRLKHWVFNKPHNSTKKVDK